MFVKHMSKYQLMKSMKNDNFAKRFQDALYEIHKLHSYDQNLYEASRCL